MIYVAKDVTTINIYIILIYIYIYIVNTYMIIHIVQCHL